MSVAAYAVGVALLVVETSALVVGSVRTRAVLVPRWTGAPARLVESAVGVSAVLAVAQVLGTVGWFRRMPFAIALIMFAVAAELVSRRLDRAEIASRAPPPVRRTELAAAAFGVALVAGQWITQLIDVYHRGMVHADTLWYHGPHAARFLQDGSITQLLGASRAPETYYAANSELLDAVVMLPFHRDLLVPLVSMGSFALILLAAWCIGRARGIAPTCMLGAAMVLALPVMAGSQVGQASNDVPAAALLLAAVALLLLEPDNRNVLGLAGVAAGFALGTKSTVLFIIAVITVGLLIQAVRSRRFAPVATWTVAVTVAGSYWYAKNLITVHNPLPGIKIGVGDTVLPLVTPPNQCCSVSHYLTNRQVWTRSFIPGFERAFSDAWPVVLGLALLGGVVAVLTGAPFAERVIGAATLGGFAGYAVTPLTAGGIATSLFLFNLRFLAPTLILGCALLPRVRPIADRSRWWLLAPPFLVALLFGYFAAHYEHAPAWPVDHAAGLVLLLAALVGVASWFLPSPRPATWTPLARRTVAAATVAATVLALFALQDAYFAGRYHHGGVDGQVYGAPFEHLHHQRVALFGTETQYELYGPDLTNVVRWVEQVSIRPGAGEPPRVAACRAWRHALSRYDYVVLVTGTFLSGPSPEPWVTTDAASRTVARGPGVRVVHVAGHLHPDDCARAVRTHPADQTAIDSASGTPST